MENPGSSNGLANNMVTNIPTINDNDNIEKSTEKDTQKTTLSSKKRLRIGYIIQSARENSIFHMISSIPNFHEKNKIEVFYYYFGSDIFNHSNSSRFKFFSDERHYRKFSSSTSVKQARGFLIKDKVQILVLLNSTINSKYNKIFNLRSNPIQIQLLFEPIDVSTICWRYLDYFITDSVTQPLSEKYLQQIIHLNRSVFMGNHKQIYNDLKKPAKLKLEEGTINCSYVRLPGGALKCYHRKMFNLPENDIVFCNFGGMDQIVRCMILLDVWSEILRNVPNSVLWLIRDPIDSKDKIKDDDFLTIQQYLITNGIIPSRIIVTDFMPRNEHITGRVPLADIFLDLTFEFSNRASCLDAIWAGIPVVTLPSECETFRVAASMLTSINCKETIANDIQHYIKIATDLRLDRNKLNNIQSKMLFSKIDCKLFDPKLYAEELETIYEKVWEKHQSELGLI